MSVAYNGLVKMHAHELSQRVAFRQQRRIPRDYVHVIARDLERLDRPHELDETIDQILLRAEAIEAEREARAATP